MARPSAAALSVATATADRRALPPSDLSEAEALLWREVVDSKPSDWFGDDSLPVLKEYVRAAAMCDRLARLLDLAMDASEKPVDAESARLPSVPELLLARDRESRRAANLATKLRLTQQSRYTPQAAATADKKAGNKRPWTVAS